MSFIERLNNIDLKDLKNIDLGELKNTIQSNPLILVNLLLVAVTLFAGILMFNNYKSKAQNMTGTYHELENKLAIVKELKVFQSDYDAFTGDFPKEISADDVIGAISDFASKRNVQILNFSPAKENKLKHISLTQIDINISTDDYRNLVLFLNDIEKAPYALRISKWTGGKSDAKNTRQVRQSKSVYINPESEIKGQISIDAIKVNHE